MRAMLDAPAQGWVGWVTPGPSHRPLRAPYQSGIHGTLDAPTQGVAWRAGVGGTCMLMEVCMLMEDVLNAHRSYNVQ